MDNVFTVTKRILDQFKEMQQAKSPEINWDELNIRTTLQHPFPEGYEVVMMGDVDYDDAKWISVSVLNRSGKVVGFCQKLLYDGANEVRDAVYGAIRNLCTQCNWDVADVFAAHKCMDKVAVKTIRDDTGKPVEVLAEPFLNMCAHTPIYLAQKWFEMRLPARGLSNPDFSNIEDVKAMVLYLPVLIETSSDERQRIGNGEGREVILEKMQKGEYKLCDQANSPGNSMVNPNGYWWDHKETIIIDF